MGWTLLLLLTLVEACPLFTDFLCDNSTTGWPRIPLCTGYGEYEVHNASDHSEPPIKRIVPMQDGARDCANGSIRCHSDSGFCQGHSCYLLQLGSNLTRGCSALNYSLSRQSASFFLSSCISPDCNNHSIDLQGNSSEGNSTVDLYSWIALMHLLLDNSTLNSTLNSTTEAPELHGLWKRNPTLGGIVIALIVILGLFALAVAANYLWKYVLVERGAEEWCESHCPDPSIFWKAIGRHPNSQRASAYFQNGHVEFSQT